MDKSDNRFYREPQDPNNIDGLQPNIDALAQRLAQAVNDRERAELHLSGAQSLATLSRKVEQECREKLDQAVKDTVALAQSAEPSPMIEGRRRTAIGSIALGLVEALDLERLHEPMKAKMKRLREKELEEEKRKAMEAVLPGFAQSVLNETWVNPGGFSEPVKLEGSRLAKTFDWDKVDRENKAYLVMPNGLYELGDGGLLRDIVTGQLWALADGGVLEPFMPKPNVIDQMTPTSKLSVFVGSARELLGPKWQLKWKQPSPGVNEFDLISMYASKGSFHKIVFDDNFNYENASAIADMLCRHTSINFTPIVKHLFPIPKTAHDVMQAERATRAADIAREGLAENRLYPEPYVQLPDRLVDPPRAEAGPGTSDNLSEEPVQLPWGIQDNHMRALFGWALDRFVTELGSTWRLVNMVRTAAVLLFRNPNGAIAEFMVSKEKKPEDPATYEELERFLLVAGFDLKAHAGNDRP